ncbi:MAG: S1 RNA-binding domain-containing protein [Candidatus Margulisbacteria bacterium]|nr:S1 RNA-binding domain-containing protein [Candidatus Margulisiibacteriota bacterium]
MSIDIGSEIEGKITGVANFGAFVELPEGNAGLIHISQIADTYVRDVSKHLKVGDVVKVKVLGSAKAGKYDLSIKQVGQASWQQQQPSPPQRRRRSREQEDQPAPGSFEDKITQFLKQSEEKQQDWKRNIDNKHGIKKKKRIV